jgi:hypothetical protein
LKSRLDSIGIDIFFLANFTAIIPIIAPGMPINPKIIAKVSENSGNKEYPEIPLKI